MCGVVFFTYISSTFTSCRVDGFVYRCVYCYNRVNTCKILLWNDSLILLQSICWLLLVIIEMVFCVHADILLACAYWTRYKITYIIEFLIQIEIIPYWVTLPLFGLFTLEMYIIIIMKCIELSDVVSKIHLTLV